MSPEDHQLFSNLRVKADAELTHVEGYSDYPMLRAELIKGYTSVRKIDLAELDLFILLRSVTYVGRNISRFGEEGSGIRNDRIIRTPRRLANDYLAT